MDIKFQYIVKKPNGHMFSEIFPLRDIERGYYSAWIKNNSVGITSEIFKLQYTGIKDKSGRELFNGDVCGRADGSTIYIDYREGAFCSVDLETMDTNLISNRNHFYYIGNIHKNPELHPLNRT